MKKFFPFLDSITSSVGHSYFIVMVFLLSHGEASGMYSSDGKLVEYSEIYSEFNNVNCPGLIGKPRVFVIQACRLDLLHQNMEPNPKSDFLVINSTLHNESSERHVENGTLFIQTFIQCLQKYSWTTHLGDIVIECNRRITETTATQNCCANSNLRKKIHLAKPQKQVRCHTDSESSSLCAKISSSSTITLPDRTAYCYRTLSTPDRSLQQLHFSGSLPVVFYTSDSEPQSTRNDVNFPGDKLSLTKGTMIRVDNLIPINKKKAH